MAKSKRSRLKTKNSIRRDRKQIVTKVDTEIHKKFSKAVNKSGYTKKKFIDITLKSYLGMARKERKKYIEMYLDKIKGPNIHEKEIFLEMTPVIYKRLKDFIKSDGRKVKVLIGSVLLSIKQID